MDREQRALTVGVPTGVGAIVLAVSGVGWIAVTLAAISLSGFGWGFWPKISGWWSSRRSAGLVDKQLAALAAQTPVSVTSSYENTEGHTVIPGEAIVGVESERSKWFLAVTNESDGKRTFRAKIEVVSRRGMQGAKLRVPYTPTWRGSSDMDTELFTGHSDRLLLAKLETELASGAAVRHYEFPFGEYDVATGRAGSKTSIWTVGGPSDDQITRPHVEFEVILSADPPLPALVRVQCLCDADGLHHEVRHG